VRVLDVFAGAGGLSLGFAAAGFDIVAGIEHDRDACETFAKAHPGATVFDVDVDAAPVASLASHVDVVIGGPPCQPWSSGGKRLATADPRNGWPAFLRVLDAARPAAFVAENVTGLASASRRKHLDALMRACRALAFDVSARVCDAADYGVPQRRRRLLIVGTRCASFAFPSPTHSAMPGARTAPWLRAGTVVAHEPQGEANPSVVTYARRPDIRPSPYDGHLFNGGGRPIDLARPAPTLLASMGGNKTPWVDTMDIVAGYHALLCTGGAPRRGVVPGARRITVEEAAQLQSFPAGMHVAGSRSSAYRQIGNAVPPLLAAAIARSLRASLERGERVAQEC
jgi:DNA (cytosine-5)-methyltransferase 1